jgi:hypothetical protein
VLKRNVAVLQGFFFTTGRPEITFSLSRAVTCSQPESTFDPFSSHERIAQSCLTVASKLRRFARPPESCPFAGRFWFSSPVGSRRDGLLLRVVPGEPFRRVEPPPRHPASGSTPSHPERRTLPGTCRGPDRPWRRPRSGSRCLAPEKEREHAARGGCGHGHGCCCGKPAKPHLFL